MNCPRCNMFLAQGAQFCPNCQLNLVQFQYQQQAVPYNAPPMNVVGSEESKKEGAYKKLLIGICFFMMGEFILRHIPGWFGDWLYVLTKYFNYLLQIAWCGLPLFIALVLSKKSRIRVVLIVLASIYAAVALYYWVYYEFFYYDWGYNDIDYSY